MLRSPAMILAWLLRAALAIAVVGGIWEGQLSIAFIAAATLALTAAPHFLARRLGVRLPAGIVAAIALFAFATLFLGEVFDFYGRFWWWDVVLHFGSAVGFGLLAYLGIFMLFEGDRYAAPPIAIAILTFCVAMAIGAIWEVFEFGMDQIFGLNMQKSGLIDTMHDLIVDMAGAAIAALTAMLHLKGRHGPVLGGFLDEFVRLNRRLFAKVSSRGR